MNDDEGRDGVDLRLDDLQRNLPEPTARGLFEHRGRPRLRLVKDAASAPGLKSPDVAAGPKPQLPRLTVPSPVAPTLPVDPWEALPEVALATQRMIAHARRAGAGDPLRHSFDHLRTSLLKTLRANGWSRIAIAAPTRGCGASFSAFHLGLSLSGVPGSRTVVLDLNLHRPGLAAVLGMTGSDMAGFLRGTTGPADHIRRADGALALGVAAGCEPRASHLLQSESCALAIGRLMDQLTPDVLLCDLPPVLEHDDLSAFLPQVDGVLLVADGTRTLPSHIAECERRLAGQTRILGVVLNRARQSGPAPAFA